MGASMSTVKLQQQQQQQQQPPAGHWGPQQQQQQQQRNSNEATADSAGAAPPPGGGRAAAAGGAAAASYSYPRLRKMSSGGTSSASSSAGEFLAGGGLLPATPVINEIALSQLSQALDVAVADSSSAAAAAAAAADDDDSEAPAPAFVAVAAFVDARENHPQLVEAESCPLHFLRCEQYNPWTAARRLLSYWETRFVVFGAERFCLPVLRHPHHQSRLRSGGTGGNVEGGGGAGGLKTEGGSDDQKQGGEGGGGEGALTESDADLLVSGSAVRLGRDGECGRPVVVVDLVSVGAMSASQRASALRCLFHVLTLCAMCNGAAQDEGVVMLLFVDAERDKRGEEEPAGGGAVDDVQRIDLDFAVKMKDLVHKSMPLRVHSVHTVCVAPGLVQQDEVAAVAAAASAAAGSGGADAGSSATPASPSHQRTRTLVFGDGFDVPCTCHYCPSMEALLRELAPFGVTEALLPLRLGGSSSSGDGELKELHKDHLAFLQRQQQQQLKTTTTSQQTSSLWHGFSTSHVSKGRLAASSALAAMGASPGSSLTRPRDIPNKKATSTNQRQPMKLQSTYKDRAYSTAEAKSDIAMPSMTVMGMISSPATAAARKRKAVDDQHETSSGGAGSASSAPEDEASRLEFIRKRNALYSRRKYHRKKIEIEVLQNQAADLKKQNQDLKGEGARLESLLQAAKQQAAAADATAGAMMYPQQNLAFQHGMYKTGDEMPQQQHMQKRQDAFPTPRNDPSPQSGVGVPSPGLSEQNMKPLLRASSSSFEPGGMLSAAGAGFHHQHHHQPGPMPIPMPLTYAAGLSHQTAMNFPPGFMSQQLQQGNPTANAAASGGNQAPTLTASASQSAIADFLGTSNKAEGERTSPAESPQGFNVTTTGANPSDGGAAMVQQQQDNAAAQSGFEQFLGGHNVQGPIPDSILELIRRKSNQNSPGDQGFR